jgi:hypothetical protein
MLFILKIIRFFSQDLFKVAPNELNYALSWLLINQIKKISTVDTFYPNKKGLLGPKTHLTLLSL